MKKVFCIVLAAYFSAFGFVSCTKNTAAPEITFGGDVTEAVVAVGDTKEIAATVTAEGRLKEVKYFRKRAGAEEFPFGSPVTKFGNPKRYECVITLRDITSDFILVIEATDRKGRTTTAEFAVNVEGGAGALAAAGTATAGIQRNVRLGFNKLNSVGSSYSVARNSVLLLPQAKAAQSEVDFMFFFGARNGITIAAPASNVASQVFNNPVHGVQTWGTRNATTFVKVDLDFENATAEQIAAAMAGDNTMMVNHLQSGDTVAFKTASGQIGLVKITQAGPNSGSTLNVDVRTI